MKRQAARLSMADTRILVVEDEQPIRDLIAFGLKRSGFEVAFRVQRGDGSGHRGRRGSGRADAAGSVI